MKDNFEVNVNDTINSGQVFLWKKFNAKWYGVNGKKILKLSEKLGTKNIEKGSLFDSKAGLYVFDKLMAGEVANTLEYEEIIKGKAALYPPDKPNKTQPLVNLQPTVGQRSRQRNFDHADTFHL